jgi:oxygen-dependent protoporphyrinogen oxidase
MTRARIAVVGAGLAGLAAAVRLEERGARVTLVDEGDAAAPLRDSLGGLEFETDLALVPREHPALAALIERAGAGGRVRAEPLEVAVEAVGDRHRSVSFGGTGLLGVGRAAPVWDAWRRARLASLVRWFRPLLDRSEPERGTRLDDRSVGDFARVYLARRRARAALEAVLELGSGLDAEATSRQVLFLSLDAGGRLSVSRLRGLALLGCALRKRLSEVRSEGRVALVRPDGRGVELEAGGKVDADAVVVATRGDRVGALLAGLSPLGADVLARIGYATRLVLAVRTAGPGGARAPVTWVAGREGGLLAGIVEADERVLLLVGRPGLASVHAPDDERGPTQALLQAGERALPGLRRRLVERRLYRSARPRFDVGHYRAIARLRSEQARLLSVRRTALAGDYLVAPDPEGAVRSGLRAADELAATLA